jgi:hypothetical protein
VRIAYEREDIYGKKVDREIYHLPADGWFATTMYGVMEVDEDALDFKLLTGSPLRGIAEKWSYRIEAKK